MFLLKSGRCSENDVFMYSPKSPLYDMSGHNDKVLAVDWSMPQYMLSGAADNELKIFRSADASVNDCEL